jgi:hypothetical protein
VVQGTGEAAGHHHAEAELLEERPRLSFARPDVVHRAGPCSGVNRETLSATPGSLNSLVGSKLSPFPGYEFDGP